MRWPTAFGRPLHCRNCMDVKMKTNNKSPWKWAALALGLFAATAQANVKVTFCVFDPLGQSGDAYAMAKDQALVAKKWGVDFVLKAYTDERVAAEDFKLGQCDGVAVTTLRGREFNPFVGSVDSIGALPAPNDMRKLVEMLADPRMASRMIHGPYEVAGVIPLGSAYVMVRDRAINSVEKAAGKKIAVLEWDKAESVIVQKLGAQAVPTDMSAFSGLFNNGQVDIIAAPAIVYRPLELFRGVGTHGAVYRFPLAQVSASLFIRRSKFPPNFGQQSREYTVTQLDRAFQVINTAEKGVAPSQWMDIPKADKEKYTHMMREARIILTRDGTYDKDMIHLLKNLRCKQYPTNAECSMNDE